MYYRFRSTFCTWKISHRLNSIYYFTGTFKSLITLFKWVLNSYCFGFIETERQIKYNWITIVTLWLYSCTFQFDVWFFQLEVSTGAGQCRKGNLRRRLWPKDRLIGLKCPLLFIKYSDIRSGYTWENKYFEHKPAYWHR